VEEDAGGGAPSLVTWVGGAPGAETDWNTAANWSPATVPVDATTSAVIPSTTYAPQLNTTVAPASIEVQAGALLTVNVSAALTTTGITNNGNISILSNTFANHVCNNGEIVVYEGNTLTVSGFLKNNGAITTTGTNSNPDVILGAHPGIPAHADASLTNDTTRYLGIGENIGVDYLVRPRGATGVVTLQDNLSARSLSINTVDPSGTLNATNRTITLTKDLTRSQGVFTVTGSTVVLNGNGVSNVANGGNPQVLQSASGPLVLNNLTLNKVSGHADLQSTVQVGGVLRLQNQNNSYVQTNAHELQVTSSSPIAVIRVPNFEDDGHGHVVGNLRRAILPITSYYEYPLGSTTRYHRATLNLPSGLTGPATILGVFNNVGSPSSTISLNETPALAQPYDRFIAGPGYWTFTPNAAIGAGTYDLTLYPSGFTAPTSTIWSFAKRDGGPWGLQGAKTGFAWPTVRRTGLTSFSDFAPIEANDEILPISDGRLSAVPLTDAIALNWRTTSEQHNMGFQLARSTQAADGYQNIAFVHGAGNSDSPRAYAHLDREVQPGITYYYRYTALSFDGESSFSNVAAARLDSDNRLAFQTSVFPNPATHATNFSVLTNRELPVQIQVVDVQGREVYRHQPGQQAAGRVDYTWDTRTVSRGLYFYTLTVGGERVTGKVVLQ
jgi:hypothetical protein